MNELLQRFGFEHKGKCRVCGGRAELYKKGSIECKIKDNGKFVLVIKNNKIVGKLNELELTLQKYVV